MISSTLFIVTAFFGLFCLNYFLSNEVRFWSVHLWMESAVIRNERASPMTDQSRLCESILTISSWLFYEICFKWCYNQSSGTLFFIPDYNTKNLQGMMLIIGGKAISNRCIFVWFILSLCVSGFSLSCTHLECYWCNDFVWCIHNICIKFVTSSYYL